MEARNMTSKAALLKLLEEKERRVKLQNLKTDFASFASSQIRIITKDASQGFIPFEFNEAQRIITQSLTKQKSETGRVRAIILKARQQGISTYCSARVFWNTYFQQHTRSVILAHDSATSDALFTMSKNLIRNMGDGLKPTELTSNAKEIKLISPAYTDKDAIGSYRLYTAG